MSTPDPVRVGEAWAVADLAKIPPPLDLTFFAPDGTPWCRFGVGFRCLNGESCRNPNHLRTEMRAGASQPQ